MARVRYTQACLKRGGGGGGGAYAPPDFGRSEGAARQRGRAVLLLAPQIVRLCNMPELLIFQPLWNFCIFSKP